MTRNEHVWPAVVVGAGAAGLLAAIFAGRGGAPVLIAETRPKPGAKIRVSGGGRCNVLPSRVEPGDFHTSGSAHALRNVLLSWPLADVHRFFEEDLGVPLKVEPTGKVFPQSDRSKDVADALLRAATRAGAVLRTPFRVTSIHPAAGTSEPEFVVESDDGERVRCRRVVLATGGLSLPKTGSDGGGLRMARALGHEIVATFPALVPLRTEDARWRELSGLSVPVRVTAERAGRPLESRAGDLLFTHRGFSGPVVLDVSRHVTVPGGSDVRLRVHWGDVPDWEALLSAGGAATVGSVLRRHVPRRLSAVLTGLAGVDAAQRLSELPRTARRALVDVLDRTVLPVSGSEGYRTAEVTGGGVPLAEVETATLASRIVPGLHFCGEILDGTGRLGGYNFLWAWVTGRRVGQAIAATHAAPPPGG